MKLLLMVVLSKSDDETLTFLRSFYSCLVSLFHSEFRFKRLRNTFGLSHHTFMSVFNVLVTVLNVFLHN